MRAYRITLITNCNAFVHFREWYDYLIFINSFLIIELWLIVKQEKNWF